MQLGLEEPCVVVLVGPSGSGKSTWARTNFRSSLIVSSDALRGLVGVSEDDQQAGKDAFEVLDRVLERRLARRLTTVVDTLGLNDDRRAEYLALAGRHDLPCYAIAFNTPAEVCRERNRAKRRPVPTKVLDGQLRKWREVRDKLAEEGFDKVHEPTEVALSPPQFVEAAELAEEQEQEPVGLRFGLAITSFDWPGGSEEIANRLAEIARAAEEVGFSGLWVMDHFRQIPQVGREWDPMLESYATLGYLAGVTSSARLGTLVTGITHRNVAHLGKIVATLDVLSRGRAICGIGAAWFEKEHEAYGWEFPATKDRFELLEDALELLPLVWGPGKPSFQGRRITVPEAMCYPRPLQDHVPILVGGSGEKKTLRLVARYADACNLFGDVATVGHKLEVLKRHCDEVDRDFDEIEVTHLSTALVGADRAEVDDLVERLRPANTSPERYTSDVNAATVEHHIGRFRQFADAGVDTEIVVLHGLGDVEPIRRFHGVIDAFHGPPS